MEQIGLDHTCYLWYNNSLWYSTSLYLEININIHPEVNGNNLLYWPCFLLPGFKGYSCACHIVVIWQSLQIIFHPFFFHLFHVFLTGLVWLTNQKCGGWSQHNEWSISFQQHVATSTLPSRLLTLRTGQINKNPKRFQKL